MFDDFEVGLYNKSTSTKVNGVTIPGELDFVKDIEVEIQTYSKALLLKEYGYDIEVTKRVYIDYFDSDVKIGTVFKYTDGYGKDISLLVKAIPWDNNFMEAMCSEL